MTEMRLCPHGFHHPQAWEHRYPHSCDGCWCEGERDRRPYGWKHDTTPSAPGSGDNTAPGSLSDTHDGTHPHNTKGDA